MNMIHDENMNILYTDYHYTVISNIILVLRLRMHFYLFSYFTERITDCD